LAAPEGRDNDHRSLIEPVLVIRDSTAPPNMT
jgi:hypothetical protein